MSNENVAKLLKIHRGSEQLNFKDIWETGLFVFDANVLLDLYRLPQSAKNDLIGVFQNNRFNGRIWTGFQVALEFLSNRLDAIADQKAKFSKVRELVTKAISGYEVTGETLITELDQLKLKKRHSVIDPDRYITHENIKKSVRFMADFLTEIDRLEEQHADVNDSDPIKDLVFKIFDGKIGESFDQKKLDDICKEGDDRYKDKVPPGFKDEKKPGFYSFGGARYVRKFGDLILWKEIISKAQSEKLKYVVLVTGDVKEDWWAEGRGKRLGPRKELLDEIYRDAPSVEAFHMYDTSSFLQYAKTYLDDKIKDSSISEAEELIASNKLVRSFSPADSFSVREMIVTAAQYSPELHIGFAESVNRLPPIRGNPGRFIRAVLEILANGFRHGTDRHVSVSAAQENGLLRLRFKNRKPLKAGFAPRWFSSRTKLFGGLEGKTGLAVVGQSLAEEGIDLEVVDTGGKFIVDLLIPLGMFV
ncbi:PIN-like domain-containing protein [Paraburkholderia denitrificans]|uniref:PIN-like domain-containing protein n=1 Tax=Paraburkholderia denitrificans TaxID=694025 RepID=A0ABW0J3N5_9BURK